MSIYDINLVITFLMQLTHDIDIIWIVLKWNFDFFTKNGKNILITHVSYGQIKISHHNKGP
ncbi:hypothetical protein T4E_11803 [Trichinella pseudospiralis]|uniref:Uncharacterized protein n=1 Tax=Trichinella pseudospiralis TaxID=6337 RepID=A0A0V0YM08_TRIPS|nr:hypothetical protein T4E_11803 [Trichinella pseudospiralis]